MGAIFEKRAFCRYICPIGLVPGVFSMLSNNEKELKQSMFAVGAIAVVYLFIGVKILTLAII